MEEDNRALRRKLRDVLKTVFEQRGDASAASDRKAPQAGQQDAIDVESMLHDAIRADAWPTGALPDSIRCQSTRRHPSKPN